MRTHLPPLLRGTGTHRAPTTAELRTEIARLTAFQTAADNYFDQLTKDRNQVHQLWKQEREKRLQAEAHIQQLQRELTALHARLANATAMSSELPTEPQGIDCRPIRQHYTAGVVPLWDSPLAGGA